MTDNNYNVIKPVESLQNVGNINAAKRREGKKKRQDSRKKEESQRKPDENELNRSTEEDTGSEITQKDAGEHSIDYCA